MNADLMSRQTNYEYVPFRENTRYQNHTTFKKLKVDHYPGGHFKIPHLWPGQNPPAT